MLDLCLYSVMCVCVCVCVCGVCVCVCVCVCGRICMYCAFTLYLH